MKTYLPKCSSGAFLARVMSALRNWNQVDGMQSTCTKKTALQIKSGWDYRPKKAIRARAALDRPGTKTSDGLSSDPFGINDNVWLNDNSLEGVAPTFINDPPEAEEPITKPLPQTD